RSPSRNAGSPNRSKISLIVQPAASSISASASLKGTPNPFARRRPTEVFPAPIIPTRTRVLSSFRMGRDYTSLALLRQQDLRARHQFRHKGGGSFADQTQSEIWIDGLEVGARFRDSVGGRRRRSGDLRFAC